MDKQVVETGATPKVTIEAFGELNLKGWDENGVKVKNTDAEHIEIEQDGNNVTVRCQTNCSVRVPVGADVTIQAVHGRAVLKNIEGNIEIDVANDDVVLRSVGSTTIEQAHSNLTAKNIFGNLKVDSVAGNATVKDIQGDCQIDQVHGNFQLDDVDGNAATQAAGNVILRFDPLPAHDYHFTAQGNLQLSLPDDASAQVTAECKGHLHIKLSGVDLDETSTEPKTFTLGDGDANIQLSAEGNLQVFSQAPDWEMGDFGADMGESFAKMGEDFATMGEDFGEIGENIAEQVTQQIEVQMEMMAQQIEAQMEALTASLGTMGMTEEQRRRIEERAQEASERAAQRAEDKMRRAQERMARKMEANQRRAERRAAEAERRSRGMAIPPIPPIPAIPAIPAFGARSRSVNEPVSEDERMTILRMLEQKKISLEQAEELLSALEGKE